ncbi:hypothetical protein BASA50_009285 [Batrachochytrium salamandrivorans]|uniref:Uncharacterized protein n=1 Tax=Batrachochytrium salamandrivorans TaxID=1357716 RepID=A0ABQ8F1U0_9FUNG|nr:hypothetical protein BASA50_009285 [Batrachochytrium salamandrivorans]
MRVKALVVAAMVITSVNAGCLTASAMSNRVLVVLGSLYGLHDKAVELSSKIPDQRKVSYELSRWCGQDADRDEQGFIEIDRMVARSELNDQDSPELKEIKKDLMALEREYREVWMASIDDCWIKFSTCCLQKKC